MALILYDFAAYLSTDLIQRGSLMWSVILMPMSVWPRQPQSLSRGRYGVTVAAGAAFRRIGRRPVLITGALIFTLACARQCSQRL